MIATVPVAELVPLEYRYALDAALALLEPTGSDMPTVCHQGAKTQSGAISFSDPCESLGLGGKQTAEFGGRSVLVRCAVAPLQRELGQRLGGGPPATPGAGLWVEPQAGHWQADLALFTAELPTSAPLIVVAARPLVRLLRERRSWGDDPLGARFGGLHQLAQALAVAGFTLRERHGLHTLGAIGLNALAAQVARLGRPELADQLHFAARLRYRSGGALAALSTLALLVARRDARGERGDASPR